MNSFPFVRHHFLRAGFEVIDCPPLTAQLKNSADIRMVMDVRDVLNHDTYFDEFITSVRRRRFYARAASPARARAPHRHVRQRLHGRAVHGHRDGEVREVDLIALLLEGRLRAMRIETREAPQQRAPRGASSKCAQCHRRRGSRSCAPPLSRCRSKRWPTARCAISVTKDRRLGLGWRRQLPRPAVRGLAGPPQVTDQAPITLTDTTRQHARRDRAERAAARGTGRASPFARGRCVPDAAPGDRRVRSRFGGSTAPAPRNRWRPTCV